MAGAADRDNAVAAEVGGVKVRMVEDVEDLRTELESVALVECHVLEDREVHAMESRSGNLRGASTQGCETRKWNATMSVGYGHAVVIQDAGFREGAGVS